MIWRCCLSSWLVLPNYLWSSPDVIKLLPCVWVENSKAEIALCACMWWCVQCKGSEHSWVLICGSLPLFAHTNKWCSSAPTQLHCTPGNLTCPTRKVTGKFWWVIQHTELAYVGKKQFWKAHMDVALCRCCKKPWSCCLFNIYRIWKLNS